MEYKYGKNDNYEIFSAGRVLYNVKGMTNFPVRLAQQDMLAFILITLLKKLKLW